MAEIHEIRGNIFESSCQTLVNTVNCVGVMGKGIAFAFRHRFPEMYEAYARACRNGRLRPGLLLLWNKSRPWILNFPTKDHWRNPSKIAYIEEGLKKFSMSYSQKGITSVAFPMLGTSQGGLNWNDVRPLMYHYLEPLKNLDVEIYYYDPSAPDSLFDKLLQRVRRFEAEDYIRNLGITRPQANAIHMAIRAGAIRSMVDFQDIPGVGEKTFNKLFRLAERSGGPFQTSHEIQPPLL